METYVQHNRTESARLLRGAIMQSLVSTALWSSSYCGDMETDAPEMMDDIAEPDDCAPALLQDLRAQCAAFLFAARRMLRPFIVRDGRDRTLARAGHDLWLTAQGHGAGFWDGDWCIRAGDLRGEPEEDIDHSDALSDIAKTYGPRGLDLYHCGDYNRGTVYG